MENLGYAFTWLTKGENSMFGKIQFADFEGTLGKMEQDVASAASALETSDVGMTGAPHYVPFAFCGKKPVRGVNYCFMAKKTQAINPPLEQIVGIEINYFDGKYEVVKSSEIVVW